MLADKYRYRRPSPHVRRSLSKQSATIEPYHESASIERANPGKQKEKTTTRVSFYSLSIYQR